VLGFFFSFSLFSQQPKRKGLLNFLKYKFFLVVEMLN